MAVLVVMLISGWMVSCDRRGEVDVDRGVAQVVIEGKEFELELAMDDASRYRGLSDRKEIAKRGGMLFVFPRGGELVFVMRRCWAPIDVVFLDPTGRVVRVHEMAVEPYETAEEKLKRYSSGWAAQYAVELRGGTARELGVAVGERIDLPVEELKRLAR